MRRNALVMAALAGAALLALASAPAYADPGSGSSGSPPGNNGTIKIHSGDTENEPIQADEPHPGCTFHIHGFNFDASSSGTWTIVAWAPTGDGQTVAASGSWSANASGEWRTAVTSLAPGHYKAFAKQTGAPGGQKQKVFWIECEASATATPTPTPTPTATISGGAAGSTPTPTPTATVSGGAAGSTPTPTPSPTQLGFQQGPIMGGVHPIIETGVGPQIQSAQAPAAQAPTAVQGVQQPGAAPVAVNGLPSTSTGPLGAASGSLALFSALAGLAWRRLRR